MLVLERPPTRLWTRAEYNRAAEQGVFGPTERLELLNGEILQKVSPQSTQHAASVGLAAESLRARQLEVHRDPGLLENGQYGYRSIQIVAADSAIATLEKPDVSIAVADLLLPA